MRASVGLNRILFTAGKVPIAGCQQYPVEGFALQHGIRRQVGVRIGRRDAGVLQLSPLHRYRIDLEALLPQLGMEGSAAGPVGQILAGAFRIVGTIDVQPHCLSAVPAGEIAQHAVLQTPSAVYDMTYDGHI